MTPSPDPELDPQLGAFLTTTLGRGLRAPLHSLLGFLQLLAMSDLDHDQTRLVDQVVASSEELLAADDRLAWVLRLLSGTHLGRPRAVRVADAAAEAVAVADVAASVHVRPGTPASAVADVPALVQLLTELLTNARAHGQAPFAVELEPAPGGAPAVRVTVTDSGTGLGPAARAQLLGPPRALGRDAGVGLLLVRRLAALLGAAVEVPTTSAGTRVSFDLPLGAVDAAPAVPAAGAPAASAPVAAVVPLRVLLVEDNATNRLLTQRQLTRLGHTMTACATGGAGVEAALAGGVDVVLMDLHLPDIDGVEATRRIRADEAARAGGARLPVIAVTADATAEARQACREAGMDQVLTKPVDLTDLAAALSRAAATDPAELPSSVPPVLRQVAARVDGDPVAAALFVSTYLAELPARRLLVQAALRRGDARTAVAAAESLRTASETMGATALAGACAALGTAVRTQSIETARAFLPALLLHSQQLHEELVPFTDEREVAAALGAVG